MDYFVGSSTDFANALRDIAATPGQNDRIIFTASFSINETFLAPIQKNTGFKLEVDGAGHAITSSNVRPFFVEAGDVSISNLSVSHAMAKGGDGGSSGAGGGGGGGMGAGGALFLGATANVTLSGVSFMDNTAEGGAGGDTSGSLSQSGGGAGGGLQGDGGDGGWMSGGGGGGFAGDGGAGAPASTYAGGGGGGLSANGGEGTVAGGGAGGGVEGGAGGQNLVNGTPGAAFGGGGGGSGPIPTPAGVGGDYGGGGGGNRVGDGGLGGFGGGGGAAGRDVAGAFHGVSAAPGFGGGKGGAVYSSAFTSDGGDGGSGYGGSIFVRDGGSLTIVNSTIAGGTVAAGVGGTGYRNDGANGDAAGKAIFLHGGAVATFAPTTSATISSDIAGTGGLAKSAAGVLTLSAMNAYTGATVVEAGKLIVDGSIAASSSVTIKTSATLGGSGTVASVAVESGGAVGPGNSAGTLTTGDIAFAGGAKLALELAGATAGQFDVLKVIGAVDLGGATLNASLLGGFSGTVGQSVAIIDNDAADAVTGTFDGLMEGATLNIGGGSFKISYVGGDGNDVTLTLLSLPPDPAPPPPPSVTEKDIAQAFAAIIGGTLSADDIAKALAPIKAGAMTLDGYINGLIAQVQKTTIPSLVISQFFGSAPSQTHLSDLAKFSAAQLEAYTKAGVLDPKIGPYEALGLGFSDTIAFNMKYGSMSDADFLSKAYQDVFGRAPTIDQAKHFADQILFFENLYVGAGQTEKQSDLHAKGAVLGQMLGVAVIHEADKHTFDDAAAAFLKNAAKGQAQWGEGLLI